jgi:hypothetical protein
MSAAVFTKPSDPWLKMLTAAVEDAERSMRWRTQQHLDAAERNKQVGKSFWASPNLVETFKLEARQAHALFNIVAALKAQYESELAKGKVWPSTENLILAGMSAYKHIERAE